MTAALTRIKNAHKRLQCAAQFTHSYPKAVYGFVRYKFDRRNGIMRGRYKNIPFYFRSADVEALKEVLVHNEYAFLSDYLAQHKQPVIIDAGHHI